MHQIETSFCPQGDPGMLAARNSVEAPHELLLTRLVQARARTDELFALIKPESIYERPIPERHRMIFYLGHLEAFDCNLLRERLLPINSFNQHLDRLFAFGIDPVGGGLPTDGPSDWPAVEEVKEYVAQIRAAIDEGLERHLKAGIKTRAEFSPDILLNVAIEHRLMHAETFTYMLHQLGLEHKFRKPTKAQQGIEPPEARMIEIPDGVATLGLSKSEGAFGWDNEFVSHTEAVSAFAIDKYKVTCRQYLGFVEAGGYEDPALWADADWEWIERNGIRHPIFWKKHKDHWHYRTMFDEVPLPLEWPVYVSQAEASAYARWAGKSLPTEAQWHRAAYADPSRSERNYPWGSEPADARFGNFDFHSWDPTPVSVFPQGESALGVADMLGNGWEWTETVFAPFEGFEPFPFYRGYSADFFDGKHFVIKGGSARTAACMLRRSFRNWFQPHYQYVYAGFRCVSN